MHMLDGFLYLSTGDWMDLGLSVTVWLWGLAKRRASRRTPSSENPPAPTDDGPAS